MVSPLAVVRVRGLCAAGVLLTPVAWNPGTPAVEMPRDPDRVIIDGRRWSVHHRHLGHGGHRRHNYREWDSEADSHPHPRHGRLGSSNQSHHDEDYNHAFPQVPFRCYSLLLGLFARLDNSADEPFNGPKCLAQPSDFCYQ